MRKETELSQNWYLRRKGGDEAWPIPRMPMQVHDILWFHRQISDGYQWGKAEDCRWVEEETWIYETEFLSDKEESLLLLEGLDTYCSIWLNGEKIGEGEDCYLPLSLSVTEFLIQGRNHLEIVFPPLEQQFSRVKKEYKEVMERDASIKPYRFFRKTFHDFTTYLGNDEDFWKIGVFRPVKLIELPGKVMLEDIRIDYTLNESLTCTQVDIFPCIYGTLEEGTSVTAEIWFQGRKLWEMQGDTGVCLKAELSGISLWWPTGYGEQPLYEVIVSLLIRGNKEDEIRKKIGFRKIQMEDMLDFSVNGRSIKLWGANLTPDRGYTLCENKERILRLLKLAQEGNVNTLRIWGEGVPFTEFLYDWADAHGILLWQEFFCGNSQYPPVREVTDKILQEAEYMVRKRRHHPSILLWCGGNECYLSRDYEDSQKEYLTASFFEYELKRLCQRLDPDRYYHINSPFYGDYANDPAKGDTHSYTNSWYVPGSGIPPFVSENLRVCFPKEESLKRYLRTEKLPCPSIQKHGDHPWPAEYEKITSAESYKKIPPVERFYDAQTGGEMIYRFGMAAGMYIQDTVEEYRRGKRAEESWGRRKCRGHFIWKWNTTFPHIYSSVLDAYLEPEIPYYFLKRAYEPLQISIEVKDHIYVWGVNDTRTDFAGTAKIKLFDMTANGFVKERALPVRIPSGESRVLDCLDSWGQLTRDKIIYAELETGTGEQAAVNHRYLDIERHLVFPEGEVCLRQEGDQLLVTADRFMRCVELIGNEEGDTYWWDFSDNYFDLFPRQEKRIKLLGKHKTGKIRAKGSYSKKWSEISWQSRKTAR